MSSPLTEVDRELLGEVANNNGVETTMAEANGEPGRETLEDPHGIQFNPLNATAGTLVKVNSKGDELDAGKGSKDTNTENAKAAPKTPKKRGAAAAANDDSSQPTKKRSPVKKAGTAAHGDAPEPVTPTANKRVSSRKKDVAGANVKTESGETDGETEGQEPVTPKKGKRASAKAKTANDATDNSVSPTKGNGNAEGTTAHNTPRKRQAPKKELAAPRGIPNSWEDADHADRMLWTMKEKGDSWSDIRAAWQAVTGQSTASSTLPNRYNRIKVNMMRMKDADKQHLLLAKKEVEDAHHTTFWATVAANMERRGADKYLSAFVQKTFKELDAAGQATVVPANDTAPSAHDAGDETTALKEEESGDGDDA